MRADEAGTLSALKSLRRELIKPKEMQYHGRTVKLMGDGALMEFASVVDAVIFAVEVQVAMAERSATVPEDRRIVYRMGLNIGDIIVEGDDIYGDGVNVAARLQGLCEPGGICLARNVFNQVKNKLDLSFEHLGEKHVKNIAEPVHAFRVLLDDKAASLVTPVIRQEPSANRGMLPIVAAVVGAVAIAAAGVSWWLPRAPDVQPASVALTPLSLPDEPSIAVLPFDNRSRDSDNAFFTDGVTEDIIIELAHNQDLFVISRNTTFAYRGKAVDVKSVGRELGVRYVLEGSVQKTGGNVHISARLVDTFTGRHIWAESYDRKEEDVFAIQRDVIRSIAGQLLSQVRAVETAAAFRKPTEDLRAYDLLKRGIHLKHTLTKDANLQAKEVLSQAIDIDPNYAEAWVYLGYAYAVDFALALTGPPHSGQLATSVGHIQKGLSLKPTLAVGFQALGYTEYYRGEFFEALNASKRSIALNPNDGDNWIFLARAQMANELYPEAVVSAERALRLNPLAPVWYNNIYSEVLYAAEQYKKGIEAARSCLSQSPLYRCRLIGVAHLVRLNRLAEARSDVAQLIKQKPEISIALARSHYDFGDADLNMRFLRDLREAGLPE